MTFTPVTGMLLSDPQETDLFIRTVLLMPKFTDYLEIGSYCGGSLCMAAANTDSGTLLYGVDPLSPIRLPREDYPDYFHDVTLPVQALLAQNLATLPDEDRARIRLVPSLSAPALPFLLRSLRIGCLLVDGGHTYEDVIADSKYIEMVVPGGFIMFHDVGRPELPGVTKGVAEVAEQLKLRKIEQRGALVVYLK